MLEGAHKKIWFHEPSLKNTQKQSKKKERKKETHINPYCKEKKSGILVVHDWILT